MTMDVVTSVMIGSLIFICVYLFWFWFCFGRCVENRQKTRNPQQRRMYVGSRSHPSISQVEPSIYVNPANLPPPPKYDAIAPPSYEEVVGVHYPNYSNYPSSNMQPITMPISTAISSNSTDNVNSNESQSNVNTRNDVAAPSTVITVTSEERRTSVTVATS